MGVGAKRLLFSMYRTSLDDCVHHLSKSTTSTQKNACVTQDLAQCGTSSQKIACITVHLTHPGISTQKIACVTQNTSLNLVHLLKRLHL